MSDETNDPKGDPLANLTDSEWRDLAEEIVRHCPSLTHLLLALDQKPEDGNPLADLN